MPKSRNHRYAVIDIGTNSVLMLVCEVGPKEQIDEVVLDTTEITRLGQGLHPTGRIQRSAIERTCATLQQCLADAQKLGVEQVITVGTSALREATNAAEFTSFVKNGLGLHVEVISGEAEARFSYLAVKTDKTFRSFDTDNLMVIDIGGGSTEFICGEADGKRYLSINLGAVYMTERFLKSDPPREDEFHALNTFIKETLSAQVHASANPIQKPLVLVGIGGTVVNLASVKLGLPRLELRAIHGETLNLQEIDNQIQQFRASTLKDRMQIPGLEAKRADVILAGAAILRCILKYLAVEQIRVSTHGVRYGVMYERFVSRGREAEFLL